MSKRKEIGQCKECQYISIKDYGAKVHLCLNKKAFPFGMFCTTLTFGCWYWKEKKK